LSGRLRRNPLDALLRTRDFNCAGEGLVSFLPRYNANIPETCGVA